MPKESVKEKKQERRASVSIFIPNMASVDDIVTAVKVLGAKGGTANIGDLVEGFGGKRKERLLSSALSSAEAFDLIEPHKKRSPYVLSDEGKKFLSASAIEEQKNILFPKFLKYKGYQDIFIRMQNDPDKTLKKEAITEAWMRIVGGGTKKLDSITH